MVAIRRSPAQTLYSSSNLFGQLKRRAASAAGTVRKNASTVKNQVRQQFAGATKSIAHSAAEEAERLFENQRERLTARVSTLSRMIRRAAHALHAVKLDVGADYANAAAKRVQDVSNSLQERELKQMINELEKVVRQHQGAAVGGLFVTGFLLARFLRATTQRPSASTGRAAPRISSRSR